MEDGFSLMELAISASISHSLSSPQIGPSSSLNSSPPSDEAMSIHSRAHKNALSSTMICYNAAEAPSPRSTQSFLHSDVEAKERSDKANLCFLQELSLVQLHMRHLNALSVEAMKEHKKLLNLYFEYVEQSWLGLTAKYFGGSTASAETECGIQSATIY